MENLGVKQRDGGSKQYMVTAINSAMDMKLLAASIKERRASMKISNNESDPIKDILVIRNNKITESLAKALEFNGLAKYVNVDEVIKVKEGERVSPEEVLNKINKITGKSVKADHVALATRGGIIAVKTEIDDTSGARDITALLAENSDANMLLVRMDTGLISQLYRKTLEIMANNNQIPTVGVRDGMLQKIAGYNVFLYFPNIEAVDLNAEVKDYERYVQEVLTKA